MKVIDLANGPIYFKLFEDTYEEMMSEGAEPDTIYVGPIVYDFLANKFSRKFLPLTNFKNALVLKDTNIGRSIWFRNSNKPELDTVIINIGG